LCDIKVFKNLLHVLVQEFTVNNSVKRMSELMQYYK